MCAVIVWSFEKQNSQAIQRSRIADFGDSGKTAYFAVQIENEGEKGLWVNALIP
jgi:hypothetical protein